MKKITFLFALLCASVMSWAATDYCHTEMSAGGKTIYLTCQEISAGNYQLKVECNEAMSGLGGSFCEVNGVGGYQLNAEGHFALAADGKTITCDIASSTAPRVYTPLYVLIDGEKNFGDVSDASWAACAGGDPTPDPDPDPTPVPDPDDHTAGGHTIHLDASYVDIDGTNKTYTLVISSTDNMEGLGGSFWNVNGVGADMRTNAGTSSYTVSGDKKTITCQVQSNSAPNIYTPLYVLMPGEISFGNVTLNWEDRTPIASEYCGQEMSSGNTLAKFTWETTAEGNVNITISEALGGASNASYFRNNGITASKIKVGEGREDVTTYFTHPGNIQGQQTLTLTLTDPANAPAPGTKIYVENQIIEYATSQEGNAWPYLTFEYTYGGVCAEEKVLTEISLTASSTFALVGDGVTLTAQGLDQMGMPIDAEISYEVSPAAAGNFAGNVFTFAKTGAATITAKSGAVEKSITLYGVPSANLALNQPSEGGYYDNNPAEGFDKANDGNNNTAWVTYADKPASVEWWYVDLGAIYSITAVDVVWGDPSSTSYKLFARTEAPSEDDKANDAAWEEIASVSGIGINSEQFNVVSVNARYVRVHSLTKSANYLRMKEVSVFGTEYVPVADTEAPVMTSASLESATFTEAVINVAATDNVGIYRFHVVDDANGIDANYAEADGKITVTGLTHATNYNFTITAKDAAGNESENSKVVAVSTPFDGSINLALNQPCEAGYEDGNPAEVAGKANDGADNTAWVTYGAHAAALDWWVVDLGEVYNLTNITALWANDAYATNYMLQARVVAPANDADKANDGAWVTLATVSGVTAGEERSTNVSGVGRYVRFRATAKAGGFFRLREFRVYGSGVATVDTEAPVMTSASLVSNTDAQAVIAVAATDNQGIANYHVVDAGNSIDGYFAAEAGNITVTGLIGGTDYTFVITAVDLFGNESANSKSVAVSTTAHYTAPQAACPAPTWDAELVKAMYSPTYSADCGFDAWGSGSVFTDDTYGKKCAVGNAYFGMVNFTLNCLMMEKVHFDIWVENNTSIRFIPIWGGTPEQGITKNLTGQEWNSIDIDLADYTSVSNWGNITQFKLDQMPTNFNLWIANAYFYRETAVVDTEAPTNASASLASAGFYSVKITAQADDDSGAVNFSVKNGDDEVATGVAASGVATTITVANLTPGTAYNFNVIAKDEAGNAAAPIAVAANTLAAPAAAPVPTEEESNVKAVYGDVYTPVVAVENYCEWWWESPTVHTNYTLGEGDHVLFYDNNHKAGASFGWAWNANNKIDFSGYQKLHMSIYPAQAGTIEVYPVVAGVTTNKVSETLTANQWNEVVLDYTDKTFAPLNQIGFINFYGLGEFFVDNVYFFREPGYTRDVTEGKYGTICLPNGGEMVGCALYEVAYFDASAKKIFFDEVLNGAMVAGTPYIFLPEENVTQLKVYYTDAANAAAGDANGLFGSYSQTLLEQNGDNYIFYNNQYLEVNSDNVYVGVNRAYIKKSQLPTQAVAPAPGRRRIAIGAAQQNPTGCENIDASETPVKVMIDGQLYILRGEKMYNANGQIVK